MGCLDTNNIYSLQDIIDHLDMLGTLNFDAEYSIKLDSYESESEKAWEVTMSDYTVWVAKSKSNYSAGDDRIDINGWLLNKIITENLD